MSFAGVSLEFQIFSITLQELLIYRRTFQDFQGIPDLQDSGKKPNSNTSQELQKTYEPCALFFPLLL